MILFCLQRRGIFVSPFVIKKIVRDLLLFIGDDCTAMPLKNFPDVDTITCVLMLCGWSFDRFDD